MTAGIERAVKRRFTGLLAAVPFGRLSRFGLIGALNTATYSILASGLINLIAVDPTLSSALAFAACIPIAFWGHKLVTYQSSNNSGDEFFRFVVVQFVGFCVAVLDMHLCATVFGLHPATAILSTIVLVPLISFVIMDRWVFRIKPNTL